MRTSIAAAIVAILFISACAGFPGPESGPKVVVDDLEHADWFYANAKPGIATEDDLQFHMSPARLWLEDNENGKTWHHSAGYRLESESQSTLGTIRTYFIVIPEYDYTRYVGTSDRVLYSATFVDGVLNSMTRLDLD